MNYLVDQLHWFQPDNILYWDDWGGEPYPMNVIQGTILARREVMPPYRISAGARIRCRLMRCFGRRPRTPFGFRAWAAWDGAISTGSTETMHGMRRITARSPRVKHLHSARLLPRMALLRDRLNDYRPRLPAMRTHLGAGTEYVNLGEFDRA